MDAALKNPKRQRKPRVNLLWTENDHGVVFAAGAPAKWMVRCKHCGAAHEQEARGIYNNSHPMECGAYAPANKIYKNVEDSKLVLKYGITLDEYGSLLRAQRYCCMLCGIHQGQLTYKMAVDHDHDTGKVRALLCRPCNQAIGLMKDDPRTAERAALYLRFHK